MIRQLLVLVLVLSFLPGAPAAPSLQQGPKLSMKEQVLAIPAGAVVEVRTIQKEKIKGRLGEANDQVFKIQRVRNDKVEEVSVDFAKAKSIKVVAVNDTVASKTGRTVGWVVLGGLATLGIILIATLAAFANN
jgi:hypothetical protein